jgi:hypothetical protein
MGRVLEEGLFVPPTLSIARLVVVEVEIVSGWLPPLMAGMLGLVLGTGRPKEVSGADVDRAEGWGNWMELRATGLWATEVVEAPRRNP